MAVYNITNATNTYDYLQMTKAVNVLSGNILGVTLLVVLSTIIFLGMKKLGVEDRATLAITGWFAVVFALLLQAGGLVGAPTVMVTMLLMLLATAFLYFKRNEVSA